MSDNANLYRKIEDGFDFILSHFQEPIFPRKIMTKGLGYQVEVFNKQEALEYFKKSKYKDCRINAYPSFTNYHGINMTPVSFLMVDLDLKDFKTSRSLEKVLYKTSERIRKEEKQEEGSISGNPTVLWTGNGYHIYQPVMGSF
jgi:threonyl-tRNA synthetase